MLQFNKHPAHIFSQQTIHSCIQDLLFTYYLYPHIIQPPSCPNASPQHGSLQHQCRTLVMSNKVESTGVILELRVGMTSQTNLDNSPDSKVHGANMGPNWGRYDPGGPHVGPMNFVIWDVSSCMLSNLLTLPGKMACHKNYNILATVYLCWKQVHYLKWICEYHRICIFSLQSGFAIIFQMQLREEIKKLRLT